MADDEVYGLTIEVRLNAGEWEAAAFPIDEDGDSGDLIAAEVGDTPADAVRALAAALDGRRDIEWRSHQ